MPRRCCFLFDWNGGRIPVFGGSELFFCSYIYRPSTFTSCLSQSQSLAEKKLKSSSSDPEGRPLLLPQAPKSCGVLEAGRPVPSTRQILQIPAVQRALVSYAFVALMAASVYAVFTLWLYTPVESGGIGFSVSPDFSSCNIHFFLHVCAFVERQD